MKVTKDLQWQNLITILKSIRMNLFSPHLIVCVKGMFSDCAITSIDVLPLV